MYFYHKKEFDNEGISIVKQKVFQIYNCNRKISTKLQYLLRRKQTHVIEKNTKYQIMYIKALKKGYCPLEVYFQLNPCLVMLQQHVGITKKVK